MGKTVYIVTGLAVMAIPAFVDFIYRPSAVCVTACGLILIRYGGWLM